MKKTIIATAGLALLAAPTAFASKARMTALGQDADGSFYIDDQRQVFKNPAHFNTYNNFVILEAGGDDTDGAAAPGATSTTNAEGGFARQSGNFVYSVYLGRDNELSATATDWNGVSDTAFIQENNRVELSIAGDAGIQWGATLWRAASEDQVSAALTKEHDSMGLRGGILMNNIDVGVELDFGGEHTGASAQGDKLENDFTFDIHADYTHGDWVFMARYETDSSEETTANVTQKDKRERNQMEFGFGHTKKLNDKATLYTNVTYKTDDRERDTGTVAEINTWSLPLTVALEAQANSWLTLRGSITQSLLDSTETKAAATSFDDKSINATAVSLGAGIAWGKLMVDGTFTALSGSGNYALGNDTINQVSVHYWF